MKQLIFSMSIIFCLFGCSSKINKEKPLIQCAVQRFEAGAGITQGEAISVTEMFTSALQSTGRFLVVERKNLDAVLKEQQFQATQDEAGESKTGKILAISKMFTGSIGKLGEDYLINVKMIDIETSKVDFAISKPYDDDLEDIGDDLMPELIEDILKRIEGNQKKK